MSAPIPVGLRRLVVERAGNRCEYCMLLQAGQEATFHIDHVEPRSHGGPTVAENLALACVSCSLRKAARRWAVDPQTGEEISLFHPRRHSWSDHFGWSGLEIVGRTAIGRATVYALKMNRALVLAVREEHAILGRAPGA